MSYALNTIDPMSSDPELDNGPTEPKVDKLYTLRGKRTYIRTYFGASHQAKSQFLAQRNYSPHLMEICPMPSSKYDWVTFSSIRIPLKEVILPHGTKNFTCKFRFALQSFPQVTVQNL
jgi:hypothetical protein